MDHKDRMTGHQRKEGHQAIMNHSRMISLGSVAKTHNKRPTRRHLKTVWKIKLTQAIHTPQKMSHVQITQHMGTKNQTMERT